jgi:hypothetical protein
MAFPDLEYVYFCGFISTHIGISRAVIVTSQQLEMFQIIHKCMTDDTCYINPLWLKVSLYSDLLLNKLHSYGYIVAKLYNGRSSALVE